MAIVKKYLNKNDSDATDPGKNYAENGELRTEQKAFGELPKSTDALKTLPQAALSDPFDTAALTVLALCMYPENKDSSLEMLDFLRGPRPMTGVDRQFIADRFRGKDYVPRSYLAGAKPENDYTPSKPYTITVESDPHSYDEPGIAKLFISSGGADSPRPIKLRKAKDGKWYLWEQYLLTDIRLPSSANPWA